MAIWNEGMIELSSVHPIFGNRYILGLTILVLFYGLSQLVFIISEKIFLRLTKKTKTNIDDQIVKRINKPVSLILFLIGINLAIDVLALHSSFASFIHKGIISLIILTVACIIIRIIGIFIENWGIEFTKKTGSSRNDALFILLNRFVNVIVYILAGIYVLDQWGVEIAPLLASLGIAGIAIAFALQNSLGNIFGGISLILDKTVKVGDVVKIDDQTGTVIDVGLRSTKIKNWDNEVIIIPNGKLADSKVQNIALPDPQVRMVIDFGVAYGTNIEKVKKIILDLVKKHKKILKDPEPSVNFIAMGDSALQFRVFCWVKDFNERFQTKEELTTQIYKALNKAKLELPFPQRTVWLYNMGKPRKKR